MSHFWSNVDVLPLWPSDRWSFSQLQIAAGASTGDPFILHFLVLDFEMFLDNIYFFGRDSERLTLFLLIKLKSSNEPNGGGYLGCQSSVSTNKKFNKFVTETRESMGFRSKQKMTLIIKNKMLLFFFIYIYVVNVFCLIKVFMKIKLSQTLMKIYYSHFWLRKKEKSWFFFCPITLAIWADHIVIKRKKVNQLA